MPAVGLLWPSEDNGDDGGARDVTLLMSGLVVAEMVLTSRFELSSRSSNVVTQVAAQEARNERDAESAVLTSTNTG